MLKRNILHGALAADCKALVVIPFEAHVTNLSVGRVQGDQLLAPL